MGLLCLYVFILLIERVIQRLLENIVIKKNMMDNETFDYQNLYSDSRGGVYKSHYKALIKEAISASVITVEQYVIAEDIQDELNNVTEVKGLKRNLLYRLKNHHSEADFKMAPFIYILEKLDPNYTIENQRESLVISSEVLKVKMRPRIDQKNAEPRLFFPEAKVALTSENDNIDNLGDILAVKDIDVYVIGLDDYWNDIYAYKIIRDERYFKVAEGFKDRVWAEFANEMNKCWF